jgi:methylmalonyl-CoA mutase N-terminal domain/subunit
LLRIDPALEPAQRDRLAEFRARRDAGAAAAALDVVERAARGRENLVTAILGAVEARATLGEISDRLRAVFGVYRPAARV